MCYFQFTENYSKIKKQKFIMKKDNLKKDRQSLADRRTTIKLEDVDVFLNSNDKKQLTLSEIKPMFDFPFFNKIQNQSGSIILQSDENVLVSAPTASGKTVLFEIAMIKYFGIDGIHIKNKIAVYISPIKALCQEKKTEWEKKFKKMWHGFEIQELTSDADFYSKKESEVELKQKVKVKANLNEKQSIINNFENFSDKNSKKQLFEKFFHNSSPKKNVEKVIENHDLMKKSKRDDHSEVLKISSIIESGLIVTTPEKFNIMLRRWKLNRDLFSNLGLIMFDEIHTIEDPERGPILETLITRLMLMKQIPQFNNTIFQNLRIIAVSATLSNIKDFSKWLNVPQENTMCFEEGDRSTVLEKIVLGYVPKKNPFLFDLSLNYRLMAVINEYSIGRPTLIFCSTQKATIKTCSDLIDYCKDRAFVKSEENFQKLTLFSNKVSNQQLRIFLKSGIGFHNAGLEPADRTIVENIFREGLLQVLVTTSTLSLGVNLPAYLVIIKSTYCYKTKSEFTRVLQNNKIEQNKSEMNEIGNNFEIDVNEEDEENEHEDQKKTQKSVSFGGYQEYSISELLQMCGRAGRPQFEPKGVAVIMTETHNVTQYSRLLHQTKNERIIESNFNNLLIDNLNNEISLNTVKDIQTAIAFYKCSFNYVRMQQNMSENELNIKVEREVKSSMDYLVKHKFVSVHGENVQVFISEVLGDEAAKQNISVFSLINLPMLQEIDLISILQILVQSIEFLFFQSRLNERKILAELNKSNHFQIKNSAINSPSKKVFVLLQCVLDRIVIGNWELKRQADEILVIAMRVLYCFRIYFKEKRSFNGYLIVNHLLKGCKREVWHLAKKAEILQFDSENVKLMESLTKVGLTKIAQIKALKFKDFKEKLSQFYTKENFLRTVYSFFSCVPVYHYSFRKVVSENNTNTNKYEFELRIPNACDHVHHWKTWVNIYELSNLNGLFETHCMVSSPLKIFKFSCKQQNRVRINIINDFYVQCEVVGIKVDLDHKPESTFSSQFNFSDDFRFLDEFIKESQSIKRIDEDVKISSKVANRYEESTNAKDFSMNGKDKIESDEKILPKPFNLVKMLQPTSTVLPIKGNENQDKKIIGFVPTIARPLLKLNFAPILKPIIKKDQSIK